MGDVLGEVAGGMEMKRPTPSLGTLPPELQQLIVEMAAEVDEDDNEEEEEMELDDSLEVDLPVNGRPGALLALSGVNRRFYELCRPLVWAEVDTQTFDNLKLRKLRDDILVRQGVHVRRLWWRQSHAELLEHEDDDEPLDGIETNPEYDEEARGEIILSILKICPNVVEIDMDLLREPRDPQRIQPLLDYIHSLANVRDLAITASQNRNSLRDMFWRLPTHAVLFLLGGKPNLEGVTLDCVDGDRYDEHDDIGSFLSSLPKLTRLDLTEAVCIKDSWSKLDWQSSLTHLAIDECDRLSARGLHALCHRFASTLISLTLERVPRLDGSLAAQQAIADMLTPKLRYTLPKLEELSITGEMPIEFIRSFGGCESVVELEIGYLPEISYGETESIIAERLFPKLKRFVAKSDTELSPGQIESIELFCHSRGIAFTVESDGSDDLNEVISNPEEYDNEDLLDLDQESYEDFDEDDFEDELDEYY